VRRPNPNRDYVADYVRAFLSLYEADAAGRPDRLLTITKKLGTLRALIGPEDRERLNRALFDAGAISRR
jgi:hypothetical protein